MRAGAEVKHTARTRIESSHSYEEHISIPIEATKSLWINLFVKWFNRRANHNAPIDLWEGFYLKIWNIFVDSTLIK